MRAMRWVLAYLAGAVVPAAWAVSLPFDGGPDERAHYEIAAWMAQHGRLPLLGADVAIALGPAGNAVDPYATHPPLAAVLAAFAVRWSSLDPLLAARLPSVLAMAGVPLVAWLLAGRLLGPRAAVVAALLVALLPQAGFVGGYVNADALGALSGALVLWRLVAGMRDGWTAPRSAWLGVACGVALLSRLTAWPVVAVAGLVLLASRRGRPALVAAGACLLVAGWWLAWNAAQYGEPTGALTLGRAIPPMQAAERAAMLTVAGLAAWWATTAGSFVACFGYMDRWLPAPVYWLALLAGLAALPGLRRLDGPEGALLAAVAAVAAFSLLVSLARDYQPQGRYLFPALAAVAVLLARGWSVLLADLHGADLRRHVADRDRDLRPHDAAGADGRIQLDGEGLRAREHQQPTEREGAVLGGGGGLVRREAVGGRAVVEPGGH